MYLVTKAAWGSYHCLSLFIYAPNVPFTYVLYWLKMLTGLESVCFTQKCSYLRDCGWMRLSLPLIQRHKIIPRYPSDCHDLCSNFPAVEAIVAIATIIWKPESIVCVLAIWSYERKLLQIRLITQCAFSNMILVDKALYPLWLSTTVSLMLHVRGVFLFLLSHACVVYTFSITCLTRSC